jgi:hypothetical protein
MFHNLSLIFYLLISSFRLSLSVLAIFTLITHHQDRLETSSILVLLPFRFPTMPPPWVLASPTRLRQGITARTLWGQTYASTARALLRRYSTASPEANPQSDSRVLADPERPDLFYHLLESPSAVSTTNHIFGLSFLNALRSRDDARSPRIIGYLPASEGGHTIEAGLNDFKENRKLTIKLGGRALLMLLPDS